MSAQLVAEAPREVESAESGLALLVGPTQVATYLLYIDLPTPYQYLLSWQPPASPVFDSDSERIPFLLCAMPAQTFRSTRRRATTVAFISLLPGTVVVNLRIVGCSGAPDSRGSSGSA